jgi:hypothetical protein
MQRPPPISYLSGPILPPSTAPPLPVPALHRRPTPPRTLSPIRPPTRDGVLRREESVEEEVDPDEDPLVAEARREKEKQLRFLMRRFPFHYCVACHKCVRCARRPAVVDTVMCVVCAVT